MGGGAVVRVSLLIMRETMHGRPEGKNQAQEELGPVQLEASGVLKVLEEKDLCGVSVRP